MIKYVYLMINNYIRFNYLYKYRIILVFNLILILSYLFNYLLFNLYDY